MIRLHEFNTNWFGAPVGIVDRSEFFDRSIEAVRQDLAPFQWVEFKAKWADAPSGLVLANHGFFAWDVQLCFRIALARRTPSPSAARLSVRSAEDPMFEFDQALCADFLHERFARLPGVTTAKVAEREAAWARAMIARAPRLCFEIRSEGMTQGWFLSQPSDRGVQLALAMLSRGAVISGRLLYERALAEYGAIGESVGWASFSVTNTAVHNVYASLGAIFTPPEVQWVWLSEAAKAGSPPPNAPASSSSSTGLRTF